MFSAGVLDGQVALVSGGGSGLGRAATLELVALGAHVVVCGRRPEPIEETVALAGERCEALVADIREEDQVDALVDDVLARHGRIDLLLNNAGGQFLAPAENITPKGFRTVMRLNVEGTWLMTHAVATKAMIPAGADGTSPGGKVLNVTLTPHAGFPGMAHSAAARAAVENLTKTLATEWARFGIRLNAIAAGKFGTDTFLTKYPERMVASAAADAPLGRMGTPEEFAQLVAFLASPAGDHFTGSVLTLDGGRDNWKGAWPDPQEADEAGVPLQEARRAGPADFTAPPA
ncbi:SDR family oxidoreductase [Patulibacter sp. NPDC049589]|uniref:SDR family oxidoreductase n=1 Tax=Patulibacter sp. NPDC049589 TaxID=3154731 RepID=UPI00343F096F